MHLRWMKVLYGLLLCAISLHAMGQAYIVEQPGKDLPFLRNRLSLAV